MSDTSLRLRPVVSLVLFLSAYSPLMVILAIKDLDFSKPYGFGSPLASISLIGAAIFFSLITLATVKSVEGGLPVVITKAANKSGDMFSYTIPYMLSFMRVDLGDWQTLLSLLLFLFILFIMAYRTQTVFINPILAISGYMLIDCTFKRDNKETQALIISRKPIDVGEFIQVNQLSHYLYIRINEDRKTEE